MITVIVHWDSTQMPHEVEWQIWRQMKAPLGIDKLIFFPIVSGLEGFNVTQYDTVEEALATTSGTRVFLEPTGTKKLSEIPVGDIVVVLGNTGEDNINVSQENERYSINTLSEPGHLYGFNAASIALAQRIGQ